MYWEQTVQHATHTDLGLRRKNNEDAAVVHLASEHEAWRRRGHLLIVADGMGGHAVGELASRMAIETVPHAFLKSQQGDARTALQQALEEANAAIHTRGSQNADFLHMGTTCDALALTPQGALIGHVGDSRVYRVRRDRVDQLTFDHSLQWEIENLHGTSEGIDLGAHKNVITRSLGPEEEVRVDIEGPYPILPGDTFVLCSDGLSNQVTDPEIGAVVRELSPQQAAKLLIHLANIRGGPDNSTVIVARIGDPPANLSPMPVEPPAEEDPGVLGWGWLGGFWGGLLTLFAGLAMIMLEHPVAGAVVASLAAIGLVVLLIAAIRFKRRMRSSRSGDDDSRTLYSRPHRTATALSSKELLESLLQIDAELERAAREDGWAVNWEKHGREHKAAQDAMKAKRFGRGVHDMAKSIDLIMSKLPRGEQG
ncbi:MAG: serine/threonine-protein phosphatase [Planctomycetaceae bacterium]|nr:serine/threonine-protein phosphatase [Planctomycetaceae bacterium]